MNAREDGLNVSFDVYPYTLGSSMLSMYLPAWVLADGPHGTLRHLADPQRRNDLQEELDNRLGPRLDDLVLCSVGSQSYEPMIGQSLREVVRALGGSLSDAIARLMLENELVVGFIGHSVTEESLDLFIRHPAAIGSSDVIFVGQQPHPRAWAAFARFRSHFVFERGVLSLEQCVRMFTGAAAEVFGFKGRGLISPGYAADLVLLNQGQLHDRATFDHPRRRATGFKRVFVNGRTVLLEGEPTGMTAGEVLRLGARDEG